MLKRALDENCNIICLGDLNINFMANNISNICRNISHKIYVQITQTYNIAILVESSFYCGFSNNKNYKRKIWDYKRVDYLLMKQKISEIDWVNLITGACSVIKIGSSKE
jgi:diphthamide synthase (EF-2-diphthine--ammonia ligase)